MKATINTLIIIGALIAAIVYMAQPEAPRYTCTPLNKVLSDYCLTRVAKYHDASFLTFEGHTRTWAYRQADKFGIKLDPQQKEYLAKYSSLEDAVNCHLTASGDASLNMTKTPAEFDAAYKLLLKTQHGE